MDDIVREPVARAHERLIAGTRIAVASRRKTPVAVASQPVAAV
jgi:hypothetical protein